MQSSQHESDADNICAEPLLEKAEISTPVIRLRRRLVAVMSAFFIFVFVPLTFWPSRSHDQGFCQQLAVRREWRTLSSSERLEYLRAVKCLSSISSSVCNGTLHDEFAYIHRQIGEYCTSTSHKSSNAKALTSEAHEAAAFLPWHRYFIHLYEQTLKQRCQYAGTLP